MDEAEWNKRAVLLQSVHKLRKFRKATRWLSWYGVGLASADRLPVVVQISAGPRESQVRPAERP